MLDVLAYVSCIMWMCFQWIMSMLLALFKAVCILQKAASRHAQQRPFPHPTPPTASRLANTHVSAVHGPLQANDFGSEVIPGAKDLGMHVQAYLYDGYWEDIGTIEAFYNANLALTKNPKPDYR